MAHTLFIRLSFLTTAAATTLLFGGVRRGYWY